MNALVSVRANALGQYSPTPEKRAEVAQQTTALARAAGMAASTVAKSAATQQTKSGDNTTTDTTDTSTMDRDMFLQLLVQQMQSQDPMAPMDNSQMLAQLAQFSSLEQMNNLNTAFATMSSNIDQLNFISASSLIGRTVTGVDVDGNVVTGTVASAAMEEGMVYLSVGDSIMSMAGVATME